MPPEIVVTGMVEEVRFHFQKLRMASTITMNLGDCGVHIVDEVTNFSASPAETQMLYHVNFGPPVLGAGAKIVAHFTHKDAERLALLERHKPQLEAMAQGR